MAEEIKEQKTLEEDILENYAHSSEIMKNGETEERLKEAKVYDQITSQLAVRSEAEQKAYESERDFQHRVKMDEMKLEIERLESQARIRDMDEKRSTDKKHKWISLGVTTGVTVVTTAVTFAFQYCMGKVNLSEGKIVGEDRVKFLDRIAEKFGRDMKK